MITNVLLAMGGLLIVSGIALVGYQVIYSPPTAATHETSQQPESAMPVALGQRMKIEARSPYPGIIMIAFGTALLLAVQLADAIRG
jgi:hypothetical protein